MSAHDRHAWDPVPRKCGSCGVIFTGDGAHTRCQFCHDEWSAIGPTERTAKLMILALRADPPLTPGFRINVAEFLDKLWAEADAAPRLRGALNYAVMIAQADEHGGATIYLDSVEWADFKAAAK